MPAAADAARNRVPAEFVGLARDLRRRIAAADEGLSAAIDAACRQVRERMTRHPVPRPDHLRTLAHRWTNDLPVLGRLALDARPAGRNLVVTEHRVIASVQRMDTWQSGDDEAGLLVIRVTVAVSRGAFRRDVMNVAVLSLHALARRYERARDRSNLAVLGDLRALAVPDPVEACAADGSFRIAPGDGAWIGRLATVGGKGPAFLAARSFVAAD